MQNKFHHVHKFSKVVNCYYYYLVIFVIVIINYKKIQRGQEQTGNYATNTNTNTNTNANNNMQLLLHLR